MTGAFIGLIITLVLLAVGAGVFVNLWGKEKRNSAALSALAEKAIKERDENARDLALLEGERQMFAREMTSRREQETLRCSCGAPGALRTVVTFDKALAINGALRVFPVRCRTCGGVVEEDRIDREKTGEVDIISEWMNDERRKVAALVASFIDHAVVPEGESPVLAGIVVLKGQLQAERDKVNDRDVTIEGLRTQLWGPMCFYCQAEEANGRTKSGEPIGPACTEAKVYENLQARAALLTAAATTE